MEKYPALLYKPGTTLALNGLPPVDHITVATDAAEKDARADGWLSLQELIDKREVKPTKSIKPPVV